MDLPIRDCVTAVGGGILVTELLPTLDPLVISSTGTCMVPVALRSDLALADRMESAGLGLLDAGGGE